MKFKVLTLFPEMVRNGLNTSIIGRAIENNLIEIKTINIRDYTQDRHGKVDDYTYGGGAGMLMQAQPVYDAWLAAVAARNGADGTAKAIPRTIYVTPQGRLFDQDYAMELSREKELIFLCGHYEGIDQRVLDEIVTDYISIGDYVLTGGELPAMVMIDAISRLVPGVLHNEESAETESFHRNLLEYPQYSRPEVWHERKVPEVLLSGDHRKIAAWRLEQSVQLTAEQRPDLYAKYLEQEAVIKQLSRNKRLHIHMMESLRRGCGEVLFHQGEMVFIYDRGCRLGMFSAAKTVSTLKSDDMANTVDKIEAGRTTETTSATDLRSVMVENAEQMLATIPEKIWDELELAVTTSETLNQILMDHLPLHVMSKCRQACYTQRNPLPVRYKDIRVLGEEHLDYLVEHYEQDGAEYLAERLSAKALFGAFSENRLIGFAGWHSDGSIGLLYVEEAYRRQGIGASLGAYCINRQLEMGYVPYGHVYQENEASITMQKRLGLYLSEESIWWLEIN